MAFLATTILFAVALLAMRTVRMVPLFSSVRDDVAPPTIIHFDPPAPKPVPKPRAEPTRARPQSTPVTQAPTVTPTTIPAPVSAPAVAVPVPVTPFPARDSASGAADAARRITDLISTRDIPTFPKSAPRTSPAPIAPAGVTSPSAPLSVAERDAILTAKMSAMAAALRRKPTEAEKRELAEQTEPGRALPNSRASNDGKVVPLMNGGASVAIPIVSFSAPLFTRKPLPDETPEQRALRLRLMDRALLLRDSLRADSIAKARIRP